MANDGQSANGTLDLQEAKLAFLEIFERMLVELHIPSYHNISNMQNLMTRIEELMDDVFGDNDD
jgi:hypothetical protein